MRKIQIIVIVLLILMLPGSPVACTAGDPSLDHILEKSIQQLMRKQHLPGFAITVVEDQEVLYQEAFGLADLENNIGATTSTVFRWWSVSKMFTALEVFREVEEGLVDLDDPLDKYLPEFTIQSRSEDERPVTVKSILAHRSGLPRNECSTPQEARAVSPWLKKFEMCTAGCFKAFPEGTRYHYSNLGYDLLGRIIEENRHEGFAPYMKKQLFEELRMEHTAFSSADISDSLTLARGYEFYKGSYYPVIRPDITSVPSGNLYATIEDLSAFLTSVFGQRVFASEKTMPRMFVDHYSTTEDPETMGLGWKTTRLDGNELLVWHDGGPDDGDGALVAFLPSRKLGIALIGNGTSLSGSISLPFAMEIFRQLIEQEGEAAGSLSPVKEKLKNPEHPLADYEGAYTAFGQLMQVKAKRRKLTGKIGGLSLEMIPVNDSTFRVTHWMDKLGLTKIIKPPIEFNKIHITFCNGKVPDARNMIINLDNITFEICPRYPDHLIEEGGWSKLIGDYRMAERLPGKRQGAFTGSIFSISTVDHTLVMSGHIGPVVPVSDHYLQILSGPFAGETMEYDPATGILAHQNALFIPIT
jgi:CubicO group peptidase (beta-lactamase class C family)